jgi:hypothetical protein
MVSARHVIGCHPTQETSVQQQALVDRARHLIGCHSTQERRAHSAFDDVAITIHESLARGAPPLLRVGEHHGQHERARR